MSLVILALAAIMLPAQSPSAPGKPLNKVRIMALLAGDVTSAHIARHVEESGVEFRATDADLQLLRATGAAEGLLKAILAAKPGPRAPRALPAAIESRILQHLARGLELRRKRQFSRAGDEYLAALKLDPQNAALHFALGDIQCQQKSMDECISTTREALRLEPDFAEALTNLGHALDDLGKQEEAMRELREAIRLDPYEAQAHYALGDILRKEDETEAAIAEIREALRLEPDNPDAHAVLGDVLYQKKDFDGAILEAREELRLRPGSAKAHVFLASLLIEKDPRAALEQLRIATELDPGDDEIRATYEKVKQAVSGLSGPEEAGKHYDRAVELRKKGNLDGAVVEYREFLRLAGELPDVPEIRKTIADAHNSLGMALRDKGDLDAAIAEYREAIRIQPDHLRAHLNLGQAFYLKGNSDEAIAAFRKAVSLDPGLAHAHYDLAAALFEKKDWDAAIAEYREALRLEPDMADRAGAHAEMGMALFQKGDAAGAVKEIGEALRLWPNNPWSHLNLAIVLSQSDPKRALEEFETACKLEDKLCGWAEDARKKFSKDKQ